MEIGFFIGFVPTVIYALFAIGGSACSIIFGEPVGRSEAGMTLLIGLIMLVGSPFLGIITGLNLGFLGMALQGIAYLVAGRFRYVPKATAVVQRRDEMRKDTSYGDARDWQIDPDVRDEGVRPAPDGGSEDVRHD